MRTGLTDTRVLAIVAIVALLAGSCTTSTTVTPTTLPDDTEASSTTSLDTASTRVQVPQLATPHRIAIRNVGGAAEFYDTITSDRFVPRGNNYNILEEANDPVNGLVAVDVTLSTDYYDPDRIEADLARMEAWGYNIVRIMPETCGATGCVTGLSGGVRGEYVDNLVDFIRRAKAHGIYTWIASNTLPDAGKYISAAHRADNAQFASANTEFLHPAGISAYRDYFTDLITSMIERGAPFDYVFGYTLRQEHSFDSAAPPLSLTSGVVTTANGVGYDMADPDEHLRMVDEGLRYWITEIRDAIRELDPTALVSVGFFAPNEPNKFRSDDDTRLVRAVAALDSDADFLDFHVYPTPPDALLKQHVENYQMVGRDEIPIIMGELAAFTWYTSEAAAAKALHDLQVESCEAGFDGWLVWSWDIPAQPDIWHATTGEGLIGEVLSPAARPDPCAPGSFEFFEASLTVGATVTASRSLPDQPPEAAIDGGSAQWGAGEGPPQYIEITLAEPSRVDEIRLTVGQYPAGTTRHELWVKTTGESLALLRVFEGSTAEDDILVFAPDTPLEDVEVVRVVTTASPSWVAWKEIGILNRGG
jgi:hypothetical protein